MWEIYDDLISMVPKDVEVSGFMAGLYWFLVRSKGVGMAMAPCEGRCSPDFTGRVAGKTVWEIAQYIKSWNSFEASLGFAAINSIINTPENIESVVGLPLKDQSGEDTFELMKDRIRGKKVATIGHFRNLDPLASICKLSILERQPMKGDIPDPACEYILPEQDFVFITGSAIINKTLPRLLELCRDAFVVLTGPSTPIAPCLFKYGVDMLAGSVIIEGEKVWGLIQEGDHTRFFTEGAQMIQIDKNGI